MRPQLRSDLARFARRLHGAGWVANHDGNVSVRLSKNRFLCTPTAVSKGDVDESMLIVVDDAGKVVEGTRKPFGELELHLAIYRARPDAQAVMHAHPPYSTAFGVAGVSLEVAVLPELLVSLGVGVPTVPLALPKTPELVKGVEAAARQSHAFLVAGNGAFSMGADLEQAYLRLELVEHCARIVSIARQLGGVRELSAEQQKKMLEARAKAGLEPPGLAASLVPPPVLQVPPAGAVPKSEPTQRFTARPAGSGATPPDYDQIAERVAARLGSRPLREGELKELIRQELNASLQGPMQGA
jgi:L-fuculose-phosphate aldolase